MRHCVADTTLIEADLDIRSRWSLRAGMARLCEWVMKEQMPESRYLDSAAELAVRGLLRDSRAQT